MAVPQSTPTGPVCGECQDVGYVHPRFSPKAWASCVCNPAGARDLLFQKRGVVTNDAARNYAALDCGHDFFLEKPVRSKSMACWKCAPLPNPPVALGQDR